MSENESIQMNRGTKRKMDSMSDSVYQMSRDELIDLVNELRRKVNELEKESKKRKTNASNQSSSEPPSEKELKVEKIVEQKGQQRDQESEIWHANAKPKVEVWSALYFLSQILYITSLRENR